MGLFSLFKKGKRDTAGDDGVLPAPADSDLLRHGVPSQLQRDIARATAMKIDAIESAMEFDIFNTPEPAWGSRAQRPRVRPAAPADGNPDTLPLLDAATTELLGDDDVPAPAAAAQTAPLIEEIAILYANGQSAVAGQMLAGALAEAAQAGMQQDRTAWWLLFDLYQLTDAHGPFDSLSIDYASTFETSPPPWNPPSATAAPAARSGVVPTIALNGRLDAGIAAQLARLDAHGNAALLRLELGRLAGFDSDGCTLLLAALQRVQARQCELTVVGAEQLAERLRAAVCVGCRDDGPAPWLLLLELLQLQNREKDFEETGMDYCVTFEVSPPSFTAPHKVAMVATAPTGQRPTSPDRFMLPAAIDGPADALLAAIDAYAAQTPSLVFDCARLARIDYGAATALLARLQPHARAGTKIAFRDVNHLVAALLRLVGYGEIARIFAHKY